MVGIVEGILRSCEVAGRHAVLWDEQGYLTGYDFLDRVGAWCAFFEDARLRRGETVSLALSQGRYVAPAVVASWLRRLRPALHNPFQGLADLGGALAQLGQPALVADRVGLPVARRLDADALDAESVQGLRPRWDGEIPDDEDLGIVGFTSGTTGLPKALLHVESRILNNFSEYDRVLSAHGRGATLVVLPTYLLPASLPSLFFALWMGNPVVVLDRFTVAGYATALMRHEVDSCMAVPSIYRELLSTPEFEGKGVRSVRWHLCGAAPIDSMTRQAFLDRFGGVISPVSGSTEVAGYLSMSREPGVASIGSAGRPLPHLGLQVLDDTGSTLSVGEVGEIALSSSAVFSGSGDGSGRFPGVEAESGLIRTGDLGYLDESGDLFLVGRTSSVVNRGGFKIYPAEVERLAMECSNADICVLVGLPDNRLGEVPILYMEGDIQRMASETSVAGYLREQLASYKLPVRIVRCPPLSLPRTNFGKIATLQVDGSVPKGGTYADF